MTGEGGDAVLIKYQKLHVRNRQITIIRSMPWKEENEKNNSREYKRRTRDTGAPPKEQLESHPPPCGRRSSLFYSTRQSNQRKSGSKHTRRTQSNET